MWRRVVPCTLRVHRGVCGARPLHAGAAALTSDGNKPAPGKGMGGAAGARKDVYLRDKFRSPGLPGPASVGNILHPDTESWGYSNEFAVLPLDEYQISDEWYNGLGALEDRMGHVFMNRNWLIQALIHPGVLKPNHVGFSCKGRLEMLGDALLEVLGCAMAVHSHHKRWPPKWALRKKISQLVSNASLLASARRLDIGRFALTTVAGRPTHHLRTIVHERFHSCIMESLVGAVYVDKSLIKALRASRHMFKWARHANVQRVMRPRIPVPIDAPCAPPEAVRHVEERCKLRMREPLWLHMALQPPRDVGNGVLRTMGDTLIKFTSAAHMFMTYPRMGEGPLTLARDAMLHDALVDQRIGFERLQLHTVLPQRESWRETLCAITGALWIDQGLPAALRFVCRQVLVPELCEGLLPGTPLLPAPPLLNELVQRDGGAVSFDTTADEETGLCTSVIRVDGVVLGSASNKTRGEAVREAATKVMDLLYPGLAHELPRYEFTHR